MTQHETNLWWGKKKTWPFLYGVSVNYKRRAQKNVLVSKKKRVTIIVLCSRNNAQIRDKLRESPT